jgi:small subunit ribosomal protein S16
MRRSIKHYMSVKIRLTRLGKKNDPFYRIIAIDESRKRGGQALEVLGHWHPQSNQVEVKKENITAWVSKGARLSPAVTKLMQ